MLFSVRHHLGDLLGVGLGKCDLRRPSVLPHVFGVPKWFTTLLPPPAGLSQCIDQVESFPFFRLEIDVSEPLSCFRCHPLLRGKRLAMNMNQFRNLLKGGEYICGSL